MQIEAPDSSACVAPESPIDKFSSLEPMRQVEVFRCWDDGTWDTDFVEIPRNTSSEDVEHDAAQAAYGAIAHSADQPFFIGIYCDPEFGDEVLPAWVLDEQEDQ